MSLQDCIVPKFLCGIIASGIIVAGATAQANPSLSDSQVQANVLRSLALAPDLATLPITMTTNSGVVTLSGSVRDDAQRTHVDQLAATTLGVRRVIDQLTVANEAVSSQNLPAPMSAGGGGAGGGVLQSDGSYTTPEATGNSVGGSQQAGGAEVPPANGPDTDAYGRPLNGQQAGAPPKASSGSYPNVQPNYGPPQGNNGPYAQQRQPYNQPYPQGYGPGQGQVGGQIVSLPAGTVLRVRVNQHLSSRDVSVGTPFDAMAISDIVADGQVAIPRGTFLQGTVVEAESSGHLKGRGELGLKLTQVTLGGRSYQIASDVFSAHGGDKTTQTVNSTVGLGALGAIFGAVAGGGVGAAVGAGAGGALGLGASAASGRGDVFIPSEAVLTFRLIQPAQVTTVSQMEMQRLASGVPAGEGRPQMVRRYPYPYYGPVAYPRYYSRPYGYYPY